MRGLAVYARKRVARLVTVIRLRHKMACKIQRAARVIVAKWRMEQQREWIEAEKLAAVVVQARWRGREGRRAFNKANEERDAFRTLIAKKVQRHWRGFLGRVEAANQYFYYMEREQQILRLQAIRRGQKARTKAAEMKVESEARRQAARVIYSWWRGFRDRELANRLRRRAYYVLCKLAGSAKAWVFRNRVERVLINRREQKKIYTQAALKIQSIWRGMLVRRRLPIVREEMNEIWGVRGFRVRKMLRKGVPVDHNMLEDNLSMKSLEKKLPLSRAKVKLTEFFGFISASLDQAALDERFSNLHGFSAEAVLGAALLRKEIAEILDLRRQDVEAAKRYVCSHSELERIFFETFVFF